MVTGTRTRKGVHEMKNLTLLCFVWAALGALALPAAAEPYWVAYEGNDLPENEGWTRTFCDADGVVGQGGAIRTIEDGVLVLDSRESVWIVDFYQMWRPISLVSGESFEMQWHVKFDEVEPYFDLGISVFADNYRAVGFNFTESTIISGFEQDVTIPFEPHVYHSYILRSNDMLTYELLIDGETVRIGQFQPVFEAGRVGWGDTVQGGRSLSHWDYLRFGVVPEPTTVLGIGLVMLLIITKVNSKRS
jgi:hypothetical protein